MTSLVQDMYDGVKEMIKREKELQEENRPSPGADIMAGSHLKSTSDITGFVNFPSECKSSLSRFMTKDIFNKYFACKDNAGVSFEQMILSGCQNVDSGIGVYAGSHDAYYTFGDLFDKIIEDYHKHGKEASHVSNMNYEELSCPPFTEEEASMIISTRIRVGRNLADFPLGPGISRDQRNEVEKLVRKAAESFTGELEGTYYALDSMTEAQRQ